MVVLPCRLAGFLRFPGTFGQVACGNPTFHRYTTQHNSISYINSVSIPDHHLA
jgi:hypothetical protein